MVCGFDLFYYIQVVTRTYINLCCRFSDNNSYILVMLRKTMETRKVLENLGLSDGETKVYLALLKIGTSPVSKIKEESELHRTTIYDFIEKLINKGLASYVIENNVKFYSATHPSKLMDFVKEKEISLNNILPELIKLNETNEEEIKIEILKGKEGFKTLLNLILRTKKDLHGYGIDETKFEENFPIDLKHFLKQEQKLGIKEKLITFKNPEFTYDVPHVTYRYFDKEFFSPTPWFAFGDYVAIMIWDPLTTILIKSKELSEGFDKQFNLLWKIAKK
jgi:HTH-type transcriptional regulator, sugar sensing transcriptional regulator